jgi:hypothetical protein
MDNILIVGNIFKNIADHKQVLSFDEVIEKIQLGLIKYAHLSLEQGVSEREIKFLKDFIRKKGLNQKFTLSSYFDTSSRCSAKFTHKIQKFNILISEPSFVAENNYSGLLMIDGRCAELRDHITGKHVQMTVLVEAARQMVLAVTEKFFIPKNLCGHLSFVANRMESNFSEFVFPFKIQILYEVIHQKILNGNNLVSKVKIYFVQNEKIVATFSFDSTVLCSKYLVYKEGIMANMIVEKNLTYLEKSIKLPLLMQ